MPAVLSAALARLRPWADTQGITCFRLHADAQVVADWYDGEVVAWSRNGQEPELGLGPVRWKTRRRQSERQHGGQYQKLDATRNERPVTEHGLRLLVNLDDYLDTGLFLDHRPLRRRVRAEAAGKRVLNLFAYTGSFSVAAAAGGAAHVTTVDLSKTYLAWAGRNLALNRLPEGALVRADCLRWLATHTARYDLIVCDPPTFSNSKAMEKSWDVSRDHPWLLWRLWNLLTPGGTAYFSTNKTNFRLTAQPPPFTVIEDITPATIDPDFADAQPHVCWRLVR
jgi:23S rRNA G2069 N7-methylase RlmK/C1962 C5-methylase RlmI